jgi:hypothetical protein
MGSLFRLGFAVLAAAICITVIYSFYVVASELS